MVDRERRREKKGRGTTKRKGKRFVGNKTERRSEQIREAGRLKEQTPFSDSLIVRLIRKCLDCFLIG